jgi:hypothetical protein
MTTVFLAGSRNLSRLADAVKDRLNNASSFASSSVMRTARTKRYSSTSPACTIATWSCIVLVNRHKKVLVYISPDRLFWTIASESDARSLLRRCG